MLELKNKIPVRGRKLSELPPKFAATFSVEKQNPRKGTETAMQITPKISHQLLLKNKIPVRGRKRKHKHKLKNQFTSVLKNKIPVRGRKLSCRRPKCTIFPKLKNKIPVRGRKLIRIFQLIKRSFCLLKNKIPVRGRKLNEFFNLIFFCHGVVEKQNPRKGTETLIMFSVN